MVLFTGVSIRSATGGIVRAVRWARRPWPAGARATGRRGRRRRTTSRPTPSAGRSAAPLDAEPSLDALDDEDGGRGRGRGAGGRGRADGGRPEPTRRPRRPPGRAGIAARDEARARRSGDWHLPPANLLKRAKPQAVDERAVEAAGAALVAALAAHGVETRLVGRTVGPVGHPLRAGARGRGQGGPGDLAVQGHRLRHGLARRADPGADPGQVGHRGRGAQPPPPAGGPGRHPGLARGGQGRSTRSRWPWAGTSPVGPSWSTWPRCPTSWCRGPPARASRRASTRC